MGSCDSQTKNKDNMANPEKADDFDQGQNISIKPAIKALCKIRIKNNEDSIKGTGFFLNAPNSKKYLITNNHIISQDLINKDIEIEIHNKKRMKINLNNRDIKYFPEPKDITMIEIKLSDSIYEDIDFLDYDINDNKDGYDMYKNLDMFSIQYSYSGTSFICGKIRNINNYEFEYSTSLDCGLSGYPICYFKNNSIKVIGINKGKDSLNKYHYGVFLGEIFKNNNETNLNNINRNINNNSDNYIIAEIEINEDDINEDKRIINSYEEFERCLGNKEYEKENMNEEIIKTTKIQINDTLIPFTYLYKFPSKGRYTIKYSFQKLLNNISYLFSECESLMKIDLSNFNSQNVTNLSYIFYKCKSLSKINLSNINTQNVTDMSYMFCRCKSLSDINISNFNTQNVTNMKDMFSWCESLSNINISNFNTQNVTDMYGMFCGCISLVSINLSNFNTQNVTDMNLMFGGCKLLKNINLENFDTKNVTEMIDMFSGCKSLKKENIKTKDEKILKLKIIKNLNKI